VGADARVDVKNADAVLPGIETAFVLVGGILLVRSGWIAIKSEKCPAAVGDVRLLTCNFQEYTAPPKSRPALHLPHPRYRRDDLSLPMTPEFFNDSHLSNFNSLPSLVTRHYS
jgi:hypothetical protein